MLSKGWPGLICTVWLTESIWRSWLELAFSKAMWMTCWRFIWVQYLCHTDLDIYLESTCMMLEATQRLVLIQPHLPCRLTPSLQSVSIAQTSCVLTQLHLLRGRTDVHWSVSFFQMWYFMQFTLRESISSLKHRLFMGWSQLMVLFGHS